MKIYKKLFSEDKKALKQISLIADEIILLEEEYKSYTDEELKAKTESFKQSIAANPDLNELLIPAYATAREAARRIMGECPYKVQIMGGIILHYNDVAEMKTGEGKTLTSIMPIYLNALSGKGVHVVTVNEYLATRDAETYGKILEFLGISIGVNKSSLSPALKREAYLQDVTYSIHSELGFDYLRDNMVKKIEDKVQRGHEFALIDECDSILIDEAKTPLIISGGFKNSSRFYVQVNNFIKTLSLDDYWIDEEQKASNLTITGQKKAESFFRLNSLYDIKNSELVHLIQNGLRANFCFLKGTEYIVKNQEVMLVDQFTGRILEGRTYSEGLHQAIQAKENVKIDEETRTVATITYQNFFRGYSKLAGMTGTAKTEEDEFRDIYNMRVICVPTNRPIIRQDKQDLVFSSMEYKIQAVIKRVKVLNGLGQPVLIGTTSVEMSERLASDLSKAGISYNILNAKNHKKEADIIAKAGHKNSITISTNMAGRGTDIKLGPGVKELGGLAVIGTGRHESRRIDNQLRGRSGRQGDVGWSRFYLSVEDDLIVRFGGDKLRTLFSKLGDEPIRSKMLSRSIINAQKRIEGVNYDSRKNVLEYDNVLSKQREVVYMQRDHILKNEDIFGIFKSMVKRVVNHQVDDSIVSTKTGAKIDYSILMKNILRVYSEFKIEQKFVEDSSIVEIKLLIENILNSKYEERRNSMPEQFVFFYEKSLVLDNLDRHWMDHIENMARLKQGIHLRGYAQKNPLQQYIEESSVLYSNFRFIVANDVLVQALSFGKTTLREDVLTNPTSISGTPTTKIGG